MNFRVATDFSKDGTVYQIVAAEMDGVTHVISEKITRTQDEEFRKALIALGWTPPEPKAFNVPLAVMREYEDGLKCSWMGKSTGGMTKPELIAFVGMLDAWVTHLTGKLVKAEPAKIRLKRSCENCGHRDGNWNCLVAIERKESAKRICGFYFNLWMDDGSGER